MRCARAQISLSHFSGSIRSYNHLVYVRACLRVCLGSPQAFLLAPTPSPGPSLGPIPSPSQLSRSSDDSGRQGQVHDGRTSAGQGSDGSQSLKEVPSLGWELWARRGLTLSPYWRWLPSWSLGSNNDVNGLESTYCLRQVTRVRTRARTDHVGGSPATEHTNWLNASLSYLVHARLPTEPRPTYNHALLRLLGTKCTLGPCGNEDHTELTRTSLVLSSGILLPPWSAVLSLPAIASHRQPFLVI